MGFKQARAMTDPSTIKCDSCGQEIPADALRCKHCGAQTALGRRVTPQRPASAFVCQVVGALTIGLGLFMMAITTGGVAVVPGIAVMLSSAFWFALARIVLLLADIAHHARK